MERINVSTTIDKILPKKILKSDFTIHRPQNLFEANWSNLKQSRCPFCANKLYKMRNGYLRCKGTKHKKSFVISDKKMKELCVK